MKEALLVGRIFNGDVDVGWWWLQVGRRWFYQGNYFYLHRWRWWYGNV